MQVHLTKTADGFPILTCGAEKKCLFGFSNMMMHYIAVKSFTYFFNNPNNIHFLDQNCLKIDHFLNNWPTVR